MNKILFSLLLFGVGTFFLSAGVPRQPRLTDYTQLWNDSPFTVKPPPEAAIPAVNPFEGYSLGGISRVEGGYYVILLNSKDPTKKVTILPDVKSDWEIVSVNWSETSWKRTTVLVRHNGREGEMGFDDSQLTLAVAPAPKVNENQRVQVRPGTPGSSTQNGGRQPRPRSITPASSQQQQAAPQTNRPSQTRQQVNPTQTQQRGGSYQNSRGTRFRRR